MSFTLTNLNYTKGQAGEYILKTFAQAKTIDNISVYPNIKNAEVIQAANFGTISGAYTTSWASDTGTGIDYKGVTLTLVPELVIQTLTIPQLEQMWDAQAYRAGALNTAPIADHTQFILDSFSKKLALEVENKIWD